MAADSDGTLTAVVICEGNLHDPDFPKKFRILLGKLKYILEQPRSKKLKVNKVEPWNSVRVTLSIPKDAAAKLRQLASEGSNALRALGILSVQLEGDTVISLRLVDQEIVLRTDNTISVCSQESSGLSSGLSDLSRVLANPSHNSTASCSIIPTTPIAITPESIAGPSRLIPQSTLGENLLTAAPAIINGPIYEKAPVFKSPNTICPMDGKLPVPPVNMNIGETREYPFESMTQARVIHRREITMAAVAALGGGQQSLTAQSSQIRPISTSPQQVLIAPSNTMVLNQTVVSENRIGSVPPPPLAIPSKPLVISQSQSQLSSQHPGTEHAINVKPQFVQPPPPPYPTVGGSHIKSPVSVQQIQQQHQHQQSNIVPLTNQVTANNNNNIAISSPLLVNLLQNDGVNQLKSSQPQQQDIIPPSSPVVLQQTVPIQLHQTMVSNMMKSPQHTDMMNSPNINHHTQNDAVIIGGNQILVNNSNAVMNANNTLCSNNININAAIPVPSSPTMSNISNLNVNHPVSHSSVGPPENIVQSQTVINPNLIGQIPQNISIRMQPQQQRFPIVQQQSQHEQHLLRQQQMMHSVVPSIQRFPTQAQPSSQQQQMINPIAQPQFRHPIQQSSPQHPYVTPPLSPHPNLTIQQQHTNINLQPNAVTINHHNPPPPQHQPQIHPSQQQIIPATYNHPRWPFKPMDSATKSSFQEFTRYQMQYNLQQQAMSQSTSSSSLGSAGTSSSAPTSLGNEQSDKSSTDPLGLGNLSDLDELTKTDLDSLLNVSDLDSALGIDAKNALESLLDEKDLVLDLIDHNTAVPLPSTSSTVAAMPSSSIAAPQLQHGLPTYPSATTPQASLSQSIMTQSVTEATPEDTNSNPFDINMRESLTSSGKQRQYLINPLTGELEPMPSEESDTEPEAEITETFTEFNSEISNSLYSDDENSCSTAFSKASDHSDTERSSNSEASSRSRNSKLRRERKDVNSGIGTGNSSNSKKSKIGLKGSSLREKIQQGIKDKISGKAKQSKEKMTKAKLILTTTDNKDSPAEKIKLRLKLEKSEPVSPAYKVDISFVQSPKRAQSTVNPAGISTGSNISSFGSGNTPSSSPTLSQQQHQNSLQINSPHSQSPHHVQQQSPASEELRVPPLHISLRGKNSIIIKNSKKDRKKSQSGEEDETYTKRSQMRRNNSVDEQSTTGNRYANQFIDEVMSKNHNHSHSPNLMNKLGQGKPITRQSGEDYHLGTQKMHLGIENGDDHDTINNSNKSMPTSKRNASDLLHNPNGLICPEAKKRKLSTVNLQIHQMLQKHFQHQQQQQQQQQQLQIQQVKQLQQMHHQQEQQAQDNVNETHCHLKGPIGSTNVGTLPQHTSLSKNQKNNNNNSSNSNSSSSSNSNSNSNNNSQIYGNKVHKNVGKSGKPVTLPVKISKSPPANSSTIVKDPGKSPPNNSQLQQSTSVVSTSAINPTTATVTMTTTSGVTILTRTADVSIAAMTMAKAKLKSGEVNINGSGIIENYSRGENEVNLKVDSEVETTDTIAISTNNISNNNNNNNTNRNKQTTIPLSQGSCDVVGEDKFKQKLENQNIDLGKSKVKCNRTNSNSNNNISGGEIVKIEKEILHDQQAKAVMISSPMSTTSTASELKVSSASATVRITPTANIPNLASTQIPSISTVTTLTSNLVTDISSAITSKNDKTASTVQQLSQSAEADFKLMDNQNDDSSKQLAKTSESSSSAINSETNLFDDRAIHSKHHQQQPSRRELINNLTKLNSDMINSQSSANPLLNTGSSNSVRHSPGSQAQGEDSGIESMDALSEKSPHQSTSPQQGDGQKPIKALHKLNDCTEKVLLDDTIIGDIEAALAKMEGLNEHLLTSCDSTNLKVNGDHVIKDNDNLLENLTNDKIVLCAPKIEYKDLNELMIDSNLDTKLGLSGHDLNENKEIISKMSLENQLLDDCCKTNIKSNNFTLTISADDRKDVLKIVPKDDKNVIQSISVETPTTGIQKEPDKESNGTSTANVQKSLSPASVAKSEALAASTSTSIQSHSHGNYNSDSNSSNSRGKETLTGKDILPPISIEIPVQIESEIPRVRTRASSKLESPLDALKQSPQLDSPANSIKSHLRHSAAMSGGTVDKPSPKNSGGKLIGNTCGNTSNSGIGATAGTAGNSIGSGNGTGKRKRQGSESSVQSGVSDDIFGRGNSCTGNSSHKKVRHCSVTSSNFNSNNGNGNHIDTVNSNSVSCRAALNTTGKKSTLTSTVASLSETSSKNSQGASAVKAKNIDESSDSDEPLIEIAGKVRNSKYTLKSTIDKEKVLRHNRVQTTNSTNVSSIITTVTTHPSTTTTISVTAVPLSLGYTGSTRTDTNTNSSQSLSNSSGDSVDLAEKAILSDQASTSSQELSSSLSVSNSSLVESKSIATAIKTTTITTILSSSQSQSTVITSTMPANLAATETPITSPTTATITTPTLTSSSNNNNSLTNINAPKSIRTTTANQNSIPGGSHHQSGHGQYSTTHSSNSNKGGISGASSTVSVSVASNFTSASSHTPNSVDDKISTRRSVRASAAANKIIYAKSGGSESVLHRSMANKNNSTSSSSETTSSDARRKTRSAAGIDTTTEGRRRRGSRDSK